MSTAAAKAEARRRAILNRGADRLAKLTTSARGEDSPVYQHADPPLAAMPPPPSNVRQFLGEDTPQMTPPSISRQSSNSPFPSAPDPSIWSEEQQRQLMAALMGGAGGFGASASPPGQPISQANTDSALPEGDPLAALMAMMPQQGQGGGGMPPGMTPGSLFGQPPAPPKPRSLLQKVMPLVHVLAGWLLLAYFILWKEPQAFSERPHAPGGAESAWNRWAELIYKQPEGSWGVQFVPFFWAFTTLTIVLHSWRIFKGLDPVQPPMLLSLALPSLPSPLPSLILNGMKYLQIGSVFLDDIAVLLFGIGMIIWVASWFAN